jgi:hypothetical protein
VPCVNHVQLRLDVVTVSLDDAGEALRALSFELNRGGKPIVAVIVRAITAVVLVAATILFIAGETVTAVAGFGLAFLGRMVMVYFELRRPD